MRDSPTVIARPAKPIVAKDDEGLIAYTDALRLSVRAKVAADQGSGLSLSEIVVQVREMVQVAEEDARHAKRFPSRAFRAISRQAVAWCIESYRPLVFAAKNGPAVRPGFRDPLPLQPAPDRHGQPDGAMPTQSPK